MSAACLLLATFYEFLTAMRKRKEGTLKPTIFNSVYNKTGLQPVSKPVEKFLVFFRKVFMQKCSFIRCGAFAAAKPVSKPLYTG